MSAYIEGMEADPGQMHPVEYLEPIADDVADSRAEVLVRLLDVVFENTKITHPECFETAFRRFVTLAHVLRSEIFDGISMVGLSKLLGVTPAMVSKTGLQFSDRLGIRGRSQKCQAARKNMAEGQLHRNAPGSPTMRLRLKHDSAVKAACVIAREKLAKGLPWTRWQRAALAEAGFLDDEGMTTAAGADFFCGFEEDNDALACPH